MNNQNMNNLIWIELSKKAVKHNIKVLRRSVGRDTLIAACIKSNAYGHGIVEMGRLLSEYGSDWLSVNSIDEAEILRADGIKCPIMVIGYVAQNELKRIIELDLRSVIYSKDSAKRLSQIAIRLKKKAYVHVKLDTGLGRQGVLSDEAIDFIESISFYQGLVVEGISTHFATAGDPEKIDYFKKQLANYRRIVEGLSRKGQVIKYMHAANSATSLVQPEAHFTMVRPGISIYGLFPSASVATQCQRRNLNLEPVLSLKTRIAQVKTLPRGACVSYGCTFTTKRETQVAILPIGYYDGIDRKLSNQGLALIGGKKAPFLGRVCMNMIVADISGIKGVKPEDEVVLIGKQGKLEISAGDLAEKIGTINYEVTTRLRESIKKRVVK